MLQIQLRIRVKIGVKYGTPTQNGKLEKDIVLLRIQGKLEKIIGLFRIQGKLEKDMIVICPSDLQHTVPSS